MTLDQATNLAEIVASIATLITLIYLAVQVRANTRVSTAEGRRNAMTQTFDIAHLISDSGEVASIFRRGLADPQSLDTDESVLSTFRDVTLIII